MDKPVFDKGRVLPDKLICVSKTRVSNARGLPRGMLMPSPRGCDKLRMPHPCDWQREQMPRGCPGGDGHRWNWLMHKTRLPPELRRVLSCKSPAVFLHFPLEEKGPWGPFYRLWQVLAKGRHLLQILLKALIHVHHPHDCMLLYITLQSSVDRY